MMKAKRQIKGMQILHIVKSFYEVQHNKHATFELRAIMDLGYAGDSKLAHWKFKWDDMVGTQRNPLNDAQLEEIYIEKIRGSEALRLYVEHYLRCPQDHSDRSYRFLSDSTDKYIREHRQRENQASLLSDSGAATKTMGAPGTTPHRRRPDQEQPAQGEG